MNRKLQTYLLGVSWFIMSLISSTVNDVIAKYAGMRLPSTEVAFFRFAFSALTLVPVIIYYGKSSLKTNNITIHIIRGTLLFCAMSAWTYGLTKAPVTTATVVSFTMPSITLILALIFLPEKIIWQRWIATVVDFVAIIIILQPHSADFNPRVLIFVAAAIAFAMLDIINKKFIVKETFISMMFYSSLVTALLSIPTTIIYWITPTTFEIFLLFILGISANLILFFLLKAFKLIDATASAPYRYFELIFSALAAFLVFNELPDKTTIYATFIIVPSALFIFYSEKNIIASKNK